MKNQGKVETNPVSIDHFDGLGLLARALSENYGQDVDVWIDAIELVFTQRVHVYFRQSRVKFNFALSSWVKWGVRPELRIAELIHRINQVHDVRLPSRSDPEAFFRARTSPFVEHDLPGHMCTHMCTHWSEASEFGR